MLNDRHDALWSIIKFENASTWIVIFILYNMSCLILLRSNDSLSSPALLPEAASLFTAYFLICCYCSF